MSADFLKQIAIEKNDLMRSKAPYYENLKKNMAPKYITMYGLFKKSIAVPGKINLIAEIKKASPSAGLIREDFDALKIAKIYAQNNAAALSVLTEEKYFLGKCAYLRKISDEIRLATLMKDFIVHEYQIFEGAFCGASAILLIMAMISDQQCKDLMDVAKTLGLDCLVEVHNEEELDRAIKVGSEIIGVNNRDLHTLKVDINNCLRIIPRIPKDKIIVAESGLRSLDDVSRVYDAGANAVLIGETFMRSPDIAAKMAEVMGDKG